MAHSFVKHNEGNIRFYSEVGIGTTIRMYLPCSASGKLSSENKTILVVDDKKKLLDPACKYLTDLSYKTLKAENANLALDTLKTEPSTDLLLTDVVMPEGMNGYEYAERTLQDYPEIKILLTSGFTSRVNAEKKPIKFDSKSELASSIRLTLDDK